MVVLPPGTLLQLMYLEERLGELHPGSFIEIGPGSGEITNLLLKHGWSGESFDLDCQTIRLLNERFKGCLENSFMGVNNDFLDIPPSHQKVDLVISCMVMEHLNDEQESLFMQQAAKLLKDNGLVIGFVPASPRYWGIEDDIAGHYRRYTGDSLSHLMKKNSWKLEHIAGVTFPISNLLLPVSNYLVQRAEKNKLTLSTLERTKLSGRRDVKFKTHFPSVIGLFLNKLTLLPFHYLQKLFSNSKHSLVIYFEAKYKVKT